MGRSARLPGKGIVPEGDVRERLLEGAAELFSAKGYAGTTVREIVERAGVTKPALYYYFRSKEGIYLDLMKAPLEGFVERIESAAREEGTARERITQVSLRAYGFFVLHLSHARIMFATYYGPPQGAPHIDFDAVQLRFQEVVSRLLKEGIRRGEFRAGNPQDMMWTVTGVVNVAMELELCRPGQSIGGEGIVRMLGIVFDGIAGHGRGAARKGRKG